MSDLADGESIEVKGSARLPYVIKNVGGVYSCTCPAWRNQSVGIERRTCKHIRQLRGEAAEQARIGQSLPARPAPTDTGKPTAPPLLLAQTWANDVDLAGWWLSEKLDGVRAWWDGKQFLSRQGNLFHVPDWFAEALPSVPLDGELWLGRKSFQRTVSIVRRQDRSDHWREISYLVFDAPAQAGPFEERLKYLRECLAPSRASHVRIHTHETCRGAEHLREELARVEALGGEGLMLRQPGSRYEAGRSFTLLKVKTFHDAEARVVEHLPGEGRHAGRLGALLVELANGTKFSVGTGFSDSQRERPPAIGSTITFRYQELSDRGVPRFPSFVRIAGEATTLPLSLPAEHPPAALSAAKAKAAPPQGISAAGAVPAPVANPQTSTEPKCALRRFEFVAGSAAKFWEVSVEGTCVTVRFGRLNTAGQSQTKTFDDGAAAQHHAEKLIREKTAKGYVERG